MPHPATDFTSGALAITQQAVHDGQRTIALRDVQAVRVTRGRLAPALACCIAGTIAFVPGGDPVIAVALLAIGGLALWIQGTTHVLRVRDGVREHAVLRSPDALQVHAALVALSEALQHWRPARETPTPTAPRPPVDAHAAHMRRAEAEILVLRSEDERAIVALARACRQPGRYARTLATAAQDGPPILLRALATLAGVSGATPGILAEPEVLDAAQFTINLDLAADAAGSSLRAD